MLETFFGFKQLPPELRARIWRFALHSESPGAHFFRLFNHSRSQTSRYGILLSNWPMDHYLLLPRWPIGPISNTSSDLRDGKDFCFDGNPSSYVTLLSLRVTCRESRYAACLHERQSRSDIRNSPAHAPACTTAGHLTPYSSASVGIDEAKQWKITCNPEDLVIFQRHPLEPKSLSPCTKGPGAGLEEWGLGMRHVGWEYHTDWLSERRKYPSADILNLLCSCALRGAKVGNLEAIWIVNYKIKRKQWVPSKEQVNKPVMDVFQMDRYRLVEVDYKDWRKLPREEATWEEVLDNPDEDATHNFLPFVNFLQDLILLLIGRQALPQQTIRVRILACEAC
ncbi:hypothetical protein BFJ72_g14728 [Fusarium proliferatum]|uniref:2EXR domain-containing protein n=1 Tax=Gibberella intermedia TaxID=948311 RepID=A0A420RYS0_GIBIN|nr:hypothetical protein BFJ72_g14728 [Fusarium proliferatum]